MSDISQSEEDFEQYFVTSDQKQSQSKGVSNKQKPSTFQEKHNINNTMQYDKENTSKCNDINNTISFIKEDPLLQNGGNAKNNTFQIKNQSNDNSNHYYRDNEINNTIGNKSIHSKGNQQPNPTHNFYSNPIKLVIDNILEFNAKFNIPLSEPWLYLRNKRAVNQLNETPISSLDLKERYLYNQIDSLTVFRPIDFFAFNHLPMYHYASITLINESKWSNRVIFNQKAKQYLNCSRLNDKASGQMTQEQPLFDQSVIIKRNDCGDLQSVIEEELFEDLKLGSNPKNPIEVLNESREWTLVQKKTKNVKFNYSNHNQPSSKPQIINHLNNPPQKPPTQPKQSPSQNTKSQTTEEGNFAKEFQEKMKKKYKQSIEHQTNDNYIKAFGLFFPIHK